MAPYIIRAMHSFMFGEYFCWCYFPDFSMDDVMWYCMFIRSLQHNLDKVVKWCYGIAIAINARWSFKTNYHLINNISDATEKNNEKHIMILPRYAGYFIIDRSEWNNDETLNEWNSDRAELNIYTIIHSVPFTQCFKCNIIVLWLLWTINSFKFEFHLHKKKTKINIKFI